MRQVKTKTTRYLAIMFAMFTLFLMIMPNAATVKLNKTKASIYKGDTVQLQVTGTTAAVKWSSSKKSVATVSSKGLVTGKKAGTATITAKVGSKKYKCKVTVKKPLPVISSTAATVQVGKTVKLTVSNASSVSWSSSDKSIATVSSKGVVTGKKAGTATIKAKASGKTLKCTVTVTKDKVIPVERIELSLKEINHVSDKYDPTITYKVTAKVLPENATNKKLTWRSTNTSVASARNNPGDTEINVYIPGTCNIIAKALDGSGVEATVKVTVRNTTQEAREQTEKELAAAKAKGPLAFIAYCEQHKYDTLYIRYTNGHTGDSSDSGRMFDVQADYKAAIDSVYIPWLQEMLKKSRAVYFTEPAFRLRAIWEYFGTLYNQQTISYGFRINPWGFCPAIATLLIDPFNTQSHPAGNPVFGDCWAAADLLKDAARLLGYSNSRRDTPNPTINHTWAYINAGGKWYMCDFLSYDGFMRYENGKKIEDETTSKESYDAAAKIVYEKYGEPDYDIGYKWKEKELPPAPTNGRLEFDGEKYYVVFD